ncbi:MAG: hypothetical protein AB1757_21640 [Acidobacteriota bacterium]
MAIANQSNFLRKVLFADAAISGTTGLVMLLFADSLNQLLGVPVGLLRYAGLSLLPFAALLIYLATRQHLQRPIIWAIISGNALWAIDSILLLFTNWVAPTALGYGFIIAQAMLVAVFAEAQYFGLKKSLPVGN